MHSRSKYTRHPSIPCHRGLLFSSSSSSPKYLNKNAVQMQSASRFKYHLMREWTMLATAATTEQCHVYICECDCRLCALDATAAAFFPWFSNKLKRTRAQIHICTKDEIKPIIGIVHIVSSIFIFSFCKFIGLNSALSSVRRFVGSSVSFARNGLDIKHLLNIQCPEKTTHQPNENCVALNWSTHIEIDRRRSGNAECTHRAHAIEIDQS